jgi:4-aminobutyrate aminotransferase-like enzyme
MKEFGILMSSDGLNHTIIKIKPPLTFTIENAREVLFYLQKVLAEDFMKII